MYLSFDHIKENKIFYFEVLLIIFLYYFLWYIHIVKLGVYIIDDADYIYRAELLLIGKKFYRDFLSGKPFLFSLTLIPFILLYYYFLFNMIDIVVFLKLIVSYFYIFGILILYKVYSKKDFILILFFTLFTPLIFKISLFLMPEIFCCFIIFLCIYLTKKYLICRQTLYIYIIFILSNLTIFLKQYLFFSISFLLYFILIEKNKIRKLLNIYLNSIIFVIILVFIIILIIGDPFNFVYSFIYSKHIVNKYIKPYISKNDIIYFLISFVYPFKFDINTLIMIIFYTIIYFTICYVFFKDKNILLKDKTLLLIFILFINICFDLIILYFVLEGYRVHYFYFYNIFLIMLYVLCLNYIKNKFQNFLLFITLFSLILYYYNVNVVTTDVFYLENQLEKEIGKSLINTNLTIASYRTHPCVYPYKKCLSYTAFSNFEVLEGDKLISYIEKVSPDIIILDNFFIEKIIKSNKIYFNITLYICKINNETKYSIRIISNVKKIKSLKKDNCYIYQYKLNNNLRDKYFHICIVSEKNSSCRVVVFLFSRYNNKIIRYTLLNVTQSINTVSWCSKNILSNLNYYYFLSIKDLIFENYSIKDIYFYKNKILVMVLKKYIYTKI